MPQGLWVGAPDGTAIFDQTTPVVKLLGTLQIGGSSNPHYTGAAQSGTIYDQRFTQYAGHTPFWCRIDGGFDNEGYDATWTFNGNYLTWTYPLPQDGALTLNGWTYYYGRPNQRIIYGIR